MFLIFRFVETSAFWEYNIGGCSFVFLSLAKLRRCGQVMRDMIAKIIEMDKTARDLTQRAQKDKINLENEIKAKKNEIRTEYLERARKRLAINETTERRLAEEQKTKIISNCKNISEAMDKAYEQNCGIWVSNIVKNVLGD